MDREKQILSKPVDTYKHTNPQVLTLLGEKLLCPFPEEENFRSANKTLMDGCKEQQMLGISSQWFCRSCNSFSFQFYFLQYKCFKTLHPCFVLSHFGLISGTEKIKKTQSSQKSSLFCNNTEKSL